MNNDQTTAKQINVNTTNGTPIPAGFVMIDANTRDTKDNKVSDALRYRNIVVPELTLPESVEVRFQSVLLEKLYSLLKARFEEEMKNTNRMGLTVNSQDYTLDGALVYYSTEASSGRMTTKQIEEWFKQGDTFAAVLAKKGEQVAKNWLDKYAKFASPNHGVNANDCKVLLAGMQPNDADSTIGKAIASRMATRIAASEQTTVEGL